MIDPRPIYRLPTNYICIGWRVAVRNLTNVKMSEADKAIDPIRRDPEGWLLARGIDAKVIIPLIQGTHGAIQTDIECGAGVRITEVILGACGEVLVDLAKTEEVKS